MPFLAVRTALGELDQSRAPSDHGPRLNFVHYGSLPHYPVERPIRL